MSTVGEIALFLPFWRNEIQANSARLPVVGELSIDEGIECVCANDG